MIKIPTAEELEALFREGRMERLGMGSCRTCYKIPGSAFCVKCYRSDEEIEEGRCGGSIKLSSSVVREIKWARFSKRRNTSCQEFRYWQKLRNKLPKELFALFPQRIELVCSSSRGWCVVEELVENFDGTKVRGLAQEYRAAGESGKQALLAAMKVVAEGFLKFSVKLYDPQNIVVQWTSAEAFCLRLLDFEPTTRSFIPFDSILPFLVRMKTKRRFKRYLRNQLGVMDFKCTIQYLMKDVISISFAATDNYSRHLAVVIASILRNNRYDRFMFHVLHRNISEQNQDLLRATAEKWQNGSVQFHKVAAEVFAEAPLPSPHISVESYFRLMLPKILEDESRTLYLDVDILCRNGLRELWEMDLDGYACAAVAEISPDCSFLSTALSIEEGHVPYFNAGVMFFNLDFIRQSGLDNEPFVILKKWKEKIGYADQDVLNLAYYGKVKFISQRYNFMGKWRDGAVRKSVVIRHFASFSQKPWNCKLMRFTWIPYACHLMHTAYRWDFFGFVFGHLRSLFYWKYNKNGIQCLDICGIRVRKKKLEDKRCE